MTTEAIHAITEAREIMQLLVAQEVDCPNVYRCSRCDYLSEPTSKYFVEDGWWHCQDCGFQHDYKDSGKVPRFPTLRRKCLCLIVVDEEQMCGYCSTHRHTDACLICHGNANILPPEVEWRSLIEDIALGMGWKVTKAAGWVMLTVPQAKPFSVAGKLKWIREYSNDPEVHADTTTNLLKAFYLALEGEC